MLASDQGTQARRWDCLACMLYFDVARGLILGRVNDENYRFATRMRETWPRAYGFSTNLMQPSSLSRNVLYIAGPR
jgi:hypothetical protein